MAHIKKSIQAKEQSLESPQQSTAPAATEVEAYPCLEKFRNDQEFRKLLHRKVEEARVSSDLIFSTVYARQWFADGLLLLALDELSGDYLPSFDLHGQCIIASLERGEDHGEMRLIEENEAHFKQYWMEHPDASLADAIRDKERVKKIGGYATPQEEAEHMLLNTEHFSNDFDSIRGFMVDDGKDAISWIDHYALRGDKFLRETFHHAMAKPLIFAMACETTLAAKDRLLGGNVNCLDLEGEINCLTAIQEIMLDVLREGVKTPGINPAFRRRVNEVIEKIEKDIGLDAQTVVTDWTMRHEEYIRQTREGQPNLQGKPKFPLPFEFQPNALEMHNVDYPPFDKDRITDYLQAWHEREPDKFREYYEDLEKIDTHQYTQRELKFRTLVLEVMRSVAAEAPVRAESFGTSTQDQARQTETDRGRISQRPQNGQGYKDIHIAFIRGCRDKKNADIIYDFYKEYGFKPTPKTIKKYRDENR